MMERKKYELSDWYKDENIIGTYDTMAEAEEAAEQFIADTDAICDLIISCWNDNLNVYMPVKSI